MRLAVYFSILFLLIAPFSGNAQRGSEDIKEVEEILFRQAERWNAGDLEGFMADYWKSDRLQFIGEKGITYGWKATLERYQKSYPDRAAMGKLTFEILDTSQRSKKVITLAGTFLLERTSGNLSGHFLLVWKKIKGHWVIITDHTCD